jgi:putative colanic acid biosynthesis UDP-glucose lipid carrier transferase
MRHEHGITKPRYPDLGTVRRLIDGLCVAAALLLVTGLGMRSIAPQDGMAMLLAVVLFYLVGEATGLFRSWRGAPLKQEVSRVWMTWLWVAPALVLIAFVTKTADQYSRIVTMAWFVAVPVLLSAERVAIRLVLEQIRRRGLNTRSVGIVGATETGERLAQMIATTPSLGMRLGGFYDDRKRSRGLPNAEHLGALTGNLEQVVDDARTGKLDVVYITLSLQAEPRIKRLVLRLADSTASVYVVPDFGVSHLLKAEWTSLGDTPVVSIFESPFFGVDGWRKRIEDVLLGSLILAIVAIPMMVVAIGVKLTSRGPVLFRQRRYGLNGQPIDVLKFRSMTVSEDGAVVRQATRADARITGLGAFLRRTSLDELPQFLHVLTGKMSIVGPRPHAVAHNEQYRSCIDGYMLRHKVKPGITGWAQVNGWRGETDTLEKMDKRIEFDLAYIRNWALLLDLKIIFLTIFGRAVHRNAF